MSAVTPAAARLAHRAAEPIHGMIYFTPHGPDAYASIGLTRQRMTYFASRSAAMGQVGAGTVIATFFNFSPAIVAEAIPAAWQIASPDRVLAARLEAADRSLRQAWGDEIGSARVREAADLARRAADRACSRPRAGRYSPAMPPCPGLTHRTWCCGTRRRYCGSTEATAT